MPELPQRPSLEHLRKQAKARRREREIALSQAQHELAREYGFDSWPKLVHNVQASGLEGIERALVLADPPALAALLGGAGRRVGLDCAAARGCVVGGAESRRGAGGGGGLSSRGEGRYRAARPCAPRRGRCSGGQRARQ